MKKSVRNMKTKQTKVSYLITVPHIKDEASLVIAEANRHIPFTIRRIYYILNADNGAHRGKHAHRKLNQVLFCIKGSVTIVLDNGKTREEFVLDKPNIGVFMDNMMWREMKDFTKDTVLLVFASEYYDEKDYIRDYDQFLYEANTGAFTKWLNKVKRVASNIRIELPRVVYSRKEN